ncbi:Cadherin_repeat domain containing protein [Candidatus Methylacidiphilaceae bacterium]
MQDKGINGFRQFWALILISFFGLQGVMAVEVTYVGKEVGDGSSSYVVQNWSLTSVGKQFNTPSGQERYGTAGYYQIRPTLNSSPLEVSEGTSQGNDFGQAAESEATLSSPPVFLSSITGGAGTFVNQGGYSTYRGSDGTTIYRQGGLSVSVGIGPHDSPAGTDASYFGEVLQFTLGASAKFRIGLAVDSVGTENHGPGIYSPDYVSIYNNATGSVFSGALTRDGNPDMVFFDIEGNAGDSFTVGLWQNTGSQSVAVLSLVTFDHQTLPAITYVGKEVSDESSSYVVQNWSAASVAKQFNTTGVERYGNAGYYQIRPTLKTSPSNVYEGTSQGNDLGQAAGTEPTLSSPPSFLSSITGRAGTFVNFGGYSNYLGSDGSTEYRQGGLSVSVGNGPYDSPAGADASYFGEVLQFTLDERTKFRIGLSVDSVADSNYAPNYVGIYNASTGSVFSAALTRDGTPDMVFFDIMGNAGDTFTVALWQNTGSRSFSALSLVTFDVSQVPTDISLSASSIAENNLENAVVGSLSTIDPDSSDAHSYSLVAGAGDSDNAIFNISGNSLRANGAFDYESKNSYSVRVRSTDLGGNTFEKVFEVSVTDVNETPSDTTPPFIELNGAASVSVVWGETYTDEGATASDDVDGLITVIPSGAVNTSKPGVYTITFDATDAAGNAANQVIRTVTVSAPSSTTGADGLSDLMRYALGGNAPGDSVAKPSSSVAGEYLVITAIVRTDNPNKLTVVGEAVTDLDNYASGTSVVEVQGVDAADQDGVPEGCKRRTFSVAIEGSVTKMFLRLKASLVQ